ncbi:hypothetical protein [Tichowtungia aerotolerans]|uniref:Uncharacterized protein n=1 Tax=Tichowtungia aerotolerans TaxID=2697043 RepID=A0A6P1MEC5_9BACT|nr:hypothetical protein [Tichowtungia aerotolerans]QHI69435.1 hypothetical protein GT409_08195 [Tichowtungia aerotolerans]
MIKYVRMIVCWVALGCMGLGQAETIAYWGWNDQGVEDETLVQKTYNEEGSSTMNIQKANSINTAGQAQDPAFTPYGYHETAWEYSGDQYGASSFASSDYETMNGLESMTIEGFFKLSASNITYRQTIIDFSDLDTGAHKFEVSVRRFADDDYRLEYSTTSLSGTTENVTLKVGGLPVGDNNTTGPIALDAWYGFAVTVAADDDSDGDARVEATIMDMATGDEITAGKNDVDLINLDLTGDANPYLTIGGELGNRSVPDSGAPVLINDFNGIIDEIRISTGLVAPEDRLYNILSFPGDPTIEAIDDIAIEVIGGTNAVLSWMGDSVGTYTLQYRSTLDSGAWSNLVENIPGVDAMMSVTNPITGSLGFYRTTAE